MKNILCYGDSNTYGYIPVFPSKSSRFDRQKRWTGILSNELGAGYCVIEEGLNARTTVWNDPVEGYYEGRDKNGKEYLMPCLDSHAPVDLVVLMLGTNDLKNRFAVSAQDIADSIFSLIGIIKNSKSGPGELSPAILIICPAPLGRLSEFEDLFIGGTEKSNNLSVFYKKIAKDAGVEFLNAGDIIKSSDIDGIHFEEKEHEKLGKAVAEKIKKIF